MAISNRGRTVHLGWLIVAAVGLAYQGCASGPAAMDRMVRPTDAEQYGHYLQAHPGQPGEAWLAWRSEATGKPVEALRQADAQLSTTKNPYSPKDPQAVRLGALVYSQSCASCHGERADSLDLTGKPLLGQQDFNNPRIRMALKFDPTIMSRWFREVDGGKVSKAVLPDGTHPQMPAMGKLLTREQIWLALDWLASDKTMEKDEVTE